MADVSKEQIELAKAAIRLHYVWGGMRDRCYNPNFPRYHRYGGRGITVEWEDFGSFFADMYPTYQDSLTLDRINNDGNYSKSNCRWATQKEQSNNRSTNVYIKHSGKTFTASQWAKHLGMKISAFNARRYKGWSMEKIMATPIRTWGGR